MADAYFRLLDDAGTTRSYASDPSTAGPWDPRFQHGGPPSALLVAAAERAAGAAGDRPDLVALRYAAEFVRPVPVDRIEVTASIVRAARSAVLVDVALHAGARLCLQARVWLVRHSDTSALATPLATPLDAPDPPRADLPGIGASFPYGESIEWRALSGSLREPGPAVVWARPTQPALADVALTGLQAAVLVGDSASGVSAELDWDVWSFQNVDLDVHLARPMHGDWLLLDAVTRIGPAGSALATSRVSDLAGPLGTTAATLVVAPRIVEVRG